MPNPSHTAATTSRATPPKSPSKTTQGSGPNGALKRDLRSKDFAAGEAALKPKSNGAGADDAAAKSNGAAKPSVATVDKKQAKKVAADLGKAQSIQAANFIMGSFLEALVPSPGTSLEVDLEMKVFVDGVMVGMDLGGRIERTKYGVEMSGDMGVALGVGAVAGAGITESKVWAALEGTMGFKAKADSAPECLDLMMLSLDRWMRNKEVTFVDALTSPFMSAMKATGNGAWLADAIFGGGFAARVTKNMDAKSKGAEADTIESTYDLGIDAGAEGKAGIGKAAVSGGATGNVRRETTSTLSKNDKGQLKTSTEKGVAGDFGLSLGAAGFKGVGAGSFFRPDDGAMRLDLSLDIGVPKGFGSTADIAKAIIRVWETAAGQAASKVGGDSGKAARKAMTDGPRASALAVLEGLGFVVPAVRIAFGMEGKKRTFAIEVTRKAEFDEAIGAGAGGSIGGSIEAGTKLLDKEWTVS